MLSTNNSSDNVYQQEQHQDLSGTLYSFLAIVLILAFIIGTIGNATVLALFLRYKSLRTVSNMLVINLTIADLMMCLFCLPLPINNYLRGENQTYSGILFCNINTFLGAFTGFLSIWSLVCLAFDRCIVITRNLPVRYSTDKIVATYVIVGVWICCLVAAALPFCGFGRYVLEGLNTSCENSDVFTRSFSNMAYNIMIQIVFFVIPVICITVCYFIITFKVRKHEKLYFRVRQSGQIDEVSFRRMCKNRKREKNEIKTAKAGLILISVFCISWTPFSIVSWISLAGNRDVLTPLAVSLPAIFAKILTILNPLLYALLLQSFKAKLALLCKKHLQPTSSSNGSIERSIPETVHHTTNFQRSKKCAGLPLREQSVSTGV